MPKTIVTLRSPAEKVAVGGPRDKWRNFTFGDHALTLIPLIAVGQELADYRSIPWWRVVSVDTTGAAVPKPEPEHV